MRSAHPQPRRGQGPTSVSVFNLGCPKNQVDAEVMLGQLVAAGYTLAESPAQADVVVVNTCGFIQDAKEESIRTILDAAALKRTGRCRALLVSGCLPQRYRWELPDLLPEVDGFVGTGEFPRIAEIVRSMLPGGDGARLWVTGHTALMTAALPRRRLSPRHVAYLKIADGCDHTCGFCAIPAIRGPMQSRRQADVVTEARQLAADGVREIVLVSQDTTSYGADRGEPRALAALLAELLTIPSLAWIRLHYLYPTRITPDLIALFAAEPRLCRYLDLPLQHADAAVLKAMGRGGSADGIRRLIGRLRRAVPGLVVRTSFIAGFPGETAAHFATLRRFVAEMRFDRVGVFRYSDEEGTAAAALRPKVPPRVAEARRARLMAIQARIAESKGQALVGSDQEVMVDGPAPGFPGLQCGRTAGHAPEVDGTVYLHGPKVPPGTFARVRIREAFEHDLSGEILEVIG
jgi:ribosomal protein S12 methylthiotransferase